MQLNQYCCESDFSSPFLLHTHTHCKTFQRRWYPIWMSLGIFNIEAYWIHCCAFTHKHTCNMSTRKCSASGNPLLSQREPKQSTRAICAHNWSSYGIIKLLDSSEFSVLTEMLFHNSYCSQAYCYLLNLCGLWSDPVNYSCFTLTPGDFMPCCVVCVTVVQYHSQELECIFMEKSQNSPGAKVW